MKALLKAIATQYPMETIALSSTASVLLKFIVSNTTLTLATKTIVIGPLDASLTMGILTGTVGAFVAHKWKKGPSDVP